ncbi:hypothetical protein [Salinactinospora qingdaonensis]|uniref:Major facilitator superfamily (MFS) profile domain-containing protein n=1 Tax=Salinactinospora qingdaonensis TaxID=702744 RepID=A0ABP7GGP0_9ACTN
MSPKKKKKTARAHGRAAPATPIPQVRPVSRTPVVLDAPRRWPVVAWVVLASVWLLGSALFALLYLAEGLALVSAAATGSAGQQARQTTATYLAALVGCAVVVPLAGAVVGLWLRRWVAAGLFAAAVAFSALLLLSLASPLDILTAIGRAFA